MGWLSQHGLELTLALVSGAWFVSRTLINVGEWKRRVERPDAVTEITRHAAQAARDLVIQDLQAHMDKIDGRLETARAKSSQTWSAVQTRIGAIEIQLAKIETRFEERADGRR